MDLRNDLMKVVYPFGSVKTKAEVLFTLPTWQPPTRMREYQSKRATPRDSLECCTVPRGVNAVRRRRQEAHGEHGQDELHKARRLLQGPVRARRHCRQYSIQRAPRSLESRCLGVLPRMA